jgi:hypothetical protein
MKSADNHRSSLTTPLGHIHTLGTAHHLTNSTISNGNGSSVGKDIGGASNPPHITIDLHSHNSASPPVPVEMPMQLPGAPDTATSDVGDETPKATSSAAIAAAAAAVTASVTAASTSSPASSTTMTLSSSNEQHPPHHGTLRQPSPVIGGGHAHGGHSSIVAALPTSTSLSNINSHSGNGSGITSTAALLLPASLMPTTSDSFGGNNTPHDTISSAPLSSLAVRVGGRPSLPPVNPSPKTPHDHTT